MRDDTIAWPSLVALAECLQEQIRIAEVPDPQFVGIMPGRLVPHDYCGTAGCGGMAYVRLVSTFPSVNGVTPNPTPLPNSPLAFNVVVGIIRCAPQPSSRGIPPGVSDQFEAARLQTADMEVLYRTLECCLRDQKGAVGSYTPIGPDGGCLGGEWGATFPEDLDA